MARRRIVTDPVQFVPVDATGILVTIEWPDLRWSFDELEGTIVRVRNAPAEDPMFDAWLDKVRAVATKVVVLGSRAGAVVPQAEVEAAARVGSHGCRTAVLELLEASSSKNKSRLTQVVGAVMSEVGL